MTDLEFILYLCNLIWEDVSDGSMPSTEEFEKIEAELTARGIDPDEVFTY